MYKKMRLSDTVRVAPEQLGSDLKHSVSMALRDKLEGHLDKTIGSIVAILSVESIGEGRITYGDGAVYYDTIFDCIVFNPEIQEIIEGVVLETVEFGAFIGLGPMDGLLHVSQVTDDYVSLDAKNGRLVCKEGGKSLSEGDRVRARIVSVSLNEREPRESKIALTMRQHALGKLEWLEDERLKDEKGEVDVE
ncbi:MAG: DNA-directed RNA polymerase [Methanosarcinales archaeon]|nr:DNA-directed RNA polymerase [Methanosarcinales archaeon]